MADSTSLFTFCSDGTQLQKWMAYSLVLPDAMWFGLTVITFANGDLYAEFLSLSYWFELLLNMCLRRLLPHSDVGDTVPSCAPSYYAPSRIAEMTYSLLFFFLALLATQHHKMRPHRSRVLFGIAVAIYIPIALVVTGNNTSTQVMWGVLVGIMSGWLRVSFVTHYLLPMRKQILSWRLTRLLGLSNCYLLNAATTPLDDSGDEGGDS